MLTYISILDLKVRVGIERITGKKARGLQAAGENKLQVVDVYFFHYTKLKEASFNSVLRTPCSALS